MVFFRKTKICINYKQFGFKMRKHKIKKNYFLFQKNNVTNAVQSCSII